MPNYVEDCKVKYITGNETDYVKCVYLNVKRYSRQENLAERGIKALVYLAKQKGTSTPITVAELSEQSEIASDQTPTRGLWPWLQAGIVGFVIKDEFWNAVTKVLDERS